MPILAICSLLFLVVKRIGAQSVFSLLPPFTLFTFTLSQFSIFIKPHGQCCAELQYSGYQTFPCVYASFLIISGQCHFISGPKPSVFAKYSRHLDFWWNLLRRYTTSFHRFRWSVVVTIFVFLLDLYRVLVAWWVNRWRNKKWSL